MTGLWAEPSLGLKRGLTTGCGIQSGVVTYSSTFSSSESRTLPGPGVGVRDSLEAVAGACDSPGVGEGVADANQTKSVS